MNRRTFERGNEGHMEFEYDNGKGPVAATSPWLQQPGQKPTMSSSNSFTSSFKSDSQNPFAMSHATANRNQPTPKQSSAQPLFRSAFNPIVHRQESGSNFRNPSFMTPQTAECVDSPMSEATAADDSPAMTDASGFMDTPDMDRSLDYGGSPFKSPAKRLLFPKSPAPKLDPYQRDQRDKVRKRKRQNGDRDVGSGRSRLPHESDESDSDYDERYQEANGRSGRSKSKKNGKTGWLRNFLGTIHDHPLAPIVLSWYLQLLVNACFIGVGVWCVWSFISMMRADLNLATEKARAVLLGEMEACAREFTMNRCAPLSSRVPAMEALCNEWEMCMNQDPSSVMKVQVSVRNVAEVINEFCSAINWKSVFMMLSVVFVVIAATNMSFGKYRQSLQSHQPAHPAPSHAAEFNPMMSPQRDRNQAYIFAPIGHTPRHIRRAFLQDDGTDTDASPDYNTIMPPPQTPSRRSPSKGERGRSPTKARSSPRKQLW